MWILKKSNEDEERTADVIAPTESVAKINDQDIPSTPSKPV